MSVRIRNILITVIQMLNVQTTKDPTHVNARLGILEMGLFVQTLMSVMQVLPRVQMEQYAAIHQVSMNVHAAVDAIVSIKVLLARFSL